jgi:hypothetical protein
MLDNEKKETEMQDLLKHQPPQKKATEIIPGKAWLGYFFQMMHVIFFCTNQFLGKLMFMRHTMSPF